MFNPQNENERQDALKAAQSPQGEATASTPTPAVSDTALPSTVPPPTSTMLPPPFTQFPFLPPFPSVQPPRWTAGAATVPRFPLPFVSPMFPPMPPYMMQNARFPMPPFGPGMPVPPWLPGNMGPGTNPPWLPGNTAQGTRPPGVPPMTGEPVRSRDTTNTESTVASTTTTSVTTTSGPAANTVVSSTSTTPTSTPPTADTKQASETPASPSPAAANTDTSSSGVRHRNVTTNRAEVPPTPPTVTRVHRHAEIRAVPPSRPSVGYLVFVGTILTIIVLLILRRLHMMKYFSLGF